MRFVALILAVVLSLASLIWANEEKQEKNITTTEETEKLDTVEKKQKDTLRNEEKKVDMHKDENKGGKSHKFSLFSFFLIIICVVIIFLLIKNVRKPNIFMESDSEKQDLKTRNRILENEKQDLKNRNRILENEKQDLKNKNQILEEKIRIMQNEKKIIQQDDESQVENEKISEPKENKQRQQEEKEHLLEKEQKKKSFYLSLPNSQGYFLDDKRQEGNFKCFPTEHSKIVEFEMVVENYGRLEKSSTYYVDPFFEISGPQNKILTNITKGKLELTSDGWKLIKKAILKYL
jgi:membrane-associated HD superfamily phosphohydrolase